MWRRSPHGGRVEGVDRQRKSKIPATPTDTDVSKESRGFREKRMSTLTKRVC